MQNSEYSKNPIKTGLKRILPLWRVWRNFRRASREVDCLTNAENAPAEKSEAPGHASRVWLQKPLDDPAEIGVVLDHPLDLLDRVHDRRVVLVVEEPPGFGVRQLRRHAAV